MPDQPATQNTPAWSALRHLVVFLASRQLVSTAVHYGLDIDPKVLTGAAGALVDIVGGGIAAGGGWLWSRLRVAPVVSQPPA